MTFIHSNEVSISCCSVPCLRRAASVEEDYEAAGGEVVLDDEGHDGWLATHGRPKGIPVTGVVFMPLSALM